MSSSALKLRRGTATQMATFVGASGEVTPNTDTNRLHLHDGVKPGGYPVARVDDSSIDGLTVGYLGDSRTAQEAIDNTSQTGTYFNQSATGRFNWTNGMLYQPFKVVINLGKSGDTSTQMLARLPALLAARPQVVLVQAGVNDISAATIASQADAKAVAASILANYQAVVVPMVAQGAMCLLSNEPGNGNFSALQMNAVQYFNIMLAAYCKATKGVRLVDSARAVRDPSLTSLFLAFPTSGDQLHNLPIGGKNQAKAIIDALQGLYPNLGARHQGVLDEFAYNPFQTLDNGQFRTTTGGTVGSNITAANGVPAAWTVSREGTGGLATVTTTPHTLPHLDANGNHDVAGAVSGQGNWLHLSATGAATGDRVSAFNSIPVARFAPGDNVFGEVEILVPNSYSLIGVEVLLDMNCTVGGVAASYAAYDFYSENTAYGTGPTNYRILARTPEKQIPPAATAINSITVWARAVFGTQNLTQRMAEIYLGNARCVKRN